MEKTSSSFARIQGAKTEVAEKSREFAAEAKDVASDIYSEASTWMQQNYGKTLAIVGAAAAVGVIGFLIGRSISSASSQRNPDVNVDMTA